ncbi:hypothetical protein [Psychroserpens sp. Hel_I_66]|uniref:hypothetical protein n=1 Tax=Psychroserpens sp. Hel_I_66 TaxID=1250004 RepID=UPI000647AC07|nr:hypothetical protein [Psychroserpens sp. Hel_I_66]
MSENLPNDHSKQDKNSTEELDLVVFFSLIGNVFSKIYKFFASIIKGIFSVFVFALKAIIDNFKIICIVLLSSFIIGFSIDKTKEPIYFSKMLVKPYFESKYQLVNNIDYYNALISIDNYDELSNIFQIPKEDTKELVSFQIEVGPETENDLIRQYDEYVQSIDSIRAQDISFEDFVDNRDLFSSDLFTIEVKSYKRDIFKSLTKGFESTFSNEYSKKLMKRRDSTIVIKKLAYRKDLQKIDSLQKVYLRILQEESKKGSVSIGLEGLIPLTQDRTITREFEMFQNELRIRDSIRVLDQQIIEQNVYYDVLSTFSDVGLKSDDILKKFALLLPALAFIILCLTFLGIKTIRFVSKYEA